MKRSKRPDAAIVDLCREESSFPAVAVSRSVALGVLVMASGCLVSGEPREEPTASAEQPMVVPSSPVFGPATLGPVLPAAGTSAIVPSSAATDVSAASIHGATFSNGADLAGPPISDRPTFRTNVTSDAFAAPPALATHLDEALARADAKVAATLTDPTAAAALSALLSAFPGGVSTSVSQRFNGYAPERARWQTRNGSTLYPDPQLFQEERERGARLYCSAREMQRRQSERRRFSMGSRALAELRIFGHPIELMVTEPTVVLDGPERFTGLGVNDGGQAFVVPLLLGSKITPIEGIGIPGLAEMRAPLVLTTADGEVRDNAQFVFGFPPAPSGFLRAFQTVTHADALVSRDATVTANLPDIPLFTIGIVDVELKLDATATIGALETHNDRALGNLAGVPFGLAPRPRAAATSIAGVTFGDMPFQLDSGTPAAPAPVAPSSVGAPWSLLPLGTGRTAMGLLAPNNPMLARLIEDDDHAVWVTHSAGFTSTLQAGIGLDIGVLALSLKVGGGLGVDGGQVVEVRDAATLEQQEPVGMVSVTPHGFVDANYRFYVELEIRFGPFGFSVPIVDVGPTPFARADTPAWEESTRFRLGTGAAHSSTGDPMRQPFVLSHLPGDPMGAFQSFPAGNDVAACLADTRPNPPTPPPCGAAPPSGGPPLVNVCLMGNAVARFPFPLGVCSDPASYVDTLRRSSFTDAQAQCVDQMLGLVCRPVSAQVGSTAVSHVTGIRPGASPDALRDEATEIADVMSQCEMAFGAGAAHSMFRVAPCRDDGEPFSPNDSLISFTAGDTPLRPPTCD